MLHTFNVLTTKDAMEEKVFGQTPGSKSSSRGSQGQWILQGAADSWQHFVLLPVHLPRCCGMRQGISPCRSGNVGQHNLCQAKISFLHPQNVREEILAPGNVRVSPQEESLPCSACSSVERQGWVQASDFAKLQRITGSVRLEKTSEVESSL